MPSKSTVPALAGRAAAKLAAALPVLGKVGPRKALARLSFGRLKIHLTGDELAGLNARAERYVDANGTLYGFVRHLLAHVPA